MNGPAILARVGERFPRSLLETHAHRGDHTAVVSRDVLLELLRFCRELVFQQLATVMEMDALDPSEYYEDIVRAMHVALEVGVTLLPPATLNVRCPFDGSANVAPSSVRNSEARPRRARKRTLGSN